jgi:hypothetical protein
MKQWHLDWVVLMYTAGDIHLHQEVHPSPSLPGGYSPVKVPLSVPQTARFL